MKGQGEKLALKFSRAIPYCEFYIYKPLFWYLGGFSYCSVSMKNYKNQIKYWSQYKGFRRKIYFKTHLRPPIDYTYVHFPLFFYISWKFFSRYMRLVPRSLAKNFKTENSTWNPLFTHPRPKFRHHLEQLPLNRIPLSFV